MSVFIFMTIFTKRHHYCRKPRTPFLPLPLCNLSPSGSTCCLRTRSFFWSSEIPALQPRRPATSKVTLSCKYVWGIFPSPRDEAPSDRVWHHEAPHRAGFQRSRWTLMSLKCVAMDVSLSPIWTSNIQVRLCLQVYLSFSDRHIMWFIIRKLKEHLL